MTASISLSPTHGQCGSSTTVTGSGFSNISTYSITFDGTTIATGATSPTGTFSKAVTIPAATLGAHTIVASVPSDGSDSKTFTVDALDWLHYGFDNMNSGYNPYERDLTTGNYANLDYMWTFTANGKLRASPIYVGGYVLLGALGGRFYSIDGVAGSERWHFDTGGDIVGTAATDLTDVFVPSGDGKLYAVNLVTGAEHWHFTADSAITTGVLYSGGKVFFGTANGTAYCVDTTAHTATWTRSTVIASACLGAPGLWSGMVFISSGNYIFAIDAAAGTITRTFNTRNTVQTAPVLNTDTDSLTYLLGGSSDHYLYAWDASNGHPIWKYWTVGDVLSTPALDIVDARAMFGLHDWRAQCVHHQQIEGYWVLDAVASAAIHSGWTMVDGAVFGAYMGNDGRVLGWDIIHASGGQAANWKWPRLSGHDAGGNLTGASWASTGGGQITFKITTNRNGGQGHGFSKGQSNLVIAGASPSGYNGTYQILSIAKSDGGLSNEDLFVVANTSNPGTYTSGGTGIWTGPDRYGAPILTNARLYLPGDDKLLVAFHIPGIS